MAASQTLPAPQLVPAAALPSAGHCALLPVQTSAASQTPEAARHCVPPDFRLHAVVDSIGSHSWHAAAGFVAPAA
ncbi:hypothetical protein ACQKGO_25545 [Corallococcus interemptor]|uniref:hypothetical protein n=1 Tax=Corallococcus interemptor TaxID=2316720 RepID=UPI003CFE2D11